MFLTLEKNLCKKEFLQKFAMIYVQLLSYELYICEFTRIGLVPLDWCHPQFGHLSRKKTLKDINSIFSKHNHKKRKDSPKTRAVLLIFLLEIEISGVAIQKILQNIKKWLLLLFQ